MLEGFAAKHKLDSSFTDTAQEWFIPLAKTIHAHQCGAKTPYFVAINGCQGSGKSTLGDFIKAYLEENEGLNVVTLSLDDFYFSRSDRLSLAVKVHPLFATRGVPGTHDMELAKTVFEELCTDGSSLTVPRFNKAQDDKFPLQDCPTVLTPIDVVIFEGWCWGARPQLISQLQTPVNEMETTEDPMGIWRQYVNRQLELSYEPLYDKMDFWVMLKAPGFDQVLNWRLEQEQKLALALADIEAPGSDNSKLMDKAQIEAFIQHYQRLTEHCLESLPPNCDWVFELDEQRHINRCIKKE